MTPDASSTPPPHFLPPEPRLPSEDEISSILVPGLREVCRSIGLKVSGRRAALEERILGYSANSLMDSEGVTG